MRVWVRGPGRESSPSSAARLSGGGIRDRKLGARWALRSIRTREFNRGRAAFRLGQLRLPWRPQRGAVHGRAGPAAGRVWQRAVSNCQLESGN